MREEIQITLVDQLLFWDDVRVWFEQGNREKGGRELWACIGSLLCYDMVRNAEAHGVSREYAAKCKEIVWIWAKVFDEIVYNLDLYHNEREKLEKFDQYDNPKKRPRDELDRAPSREDVLYFNVSKSTSSFITFFLKTVDILNYIDYPLSAGLGLTVLEHKEYEDVNYNLEMPGRLWKGVTEIELKDDVYYSGDLIDALADKKIKATLVTPPVTPPRPSFMQDFLTIYNNLDTSIKLMKNALELKSYIDYALAITKKLGVDLDNEINQIRNIYDGEMYDYYVNSINNIEYYKLNESFGSKSTILDDIRDMYENLKSNLSVPRRVIEEKDELIALYETIMNKIDASLILNDAEKDEKIEEVKVKVSLIREFIEKIDEFKEIEESANKTVNGIQEKLTTYNENKEAAIEATRNVRNEYFRRKEAFTEAFVRANFTKHEYRLIGNAAVDKLEHDCYLQRRQEAYEAVYIRRYSRVGGDTTHCQAVPPPRRPPPRPPSPEPEYKSYIALSLVTSGEKAVIIIEASNDEDIDNVEIGEVTTLYGINIEKMKKTIGIRKFKNKFDALMELEDYRRMFKPALQDVYIFDTLDKEIGEEVYNVAFFVSDKDSAGYYYKMIMDGELSNELNDTIKLANSTDLKQFTDNEVNKVTNFYENYEESKEPYTIIDQDLFKYYKYDEKEEEDINDDDLAY